MQLSPSEIHDIAHLAHEANRSYCASIGDYSQEPWFNATQSQRDSAIAGIKFILLNLRSTPEDVHASWTAHKVAAGWVYGETKCESAKTHPCIVKYVDLPESQKIKDYIYSNVVKGAFEFIDATRG